MSIAWLEKIYRMSTHSWVTLYINRSSLNSLYSLTLSTYLEEFPGLVHFLYIDRTTHRVTAPSLDMDTAEGLFTKKKVAMMFPISVECYNVYCI